MSWERRIYCEQTPERSTGEDMSDSDCHRYEVLVRDDDGAELGCVMQFFDGHASYAIVGSGRLGAFETFDAARSAVEQNIARAQ